MNVVTGHFIEAHGALTFHQQLPLMVGYAYSTNIPDDTVTLTSSPSLPTIYETAEGLN